MTLKVDEFRVFHEEEGCLKTGVDKWLHKHPNAEIKHLTCSKANDSHWIYFVVLYTDEVFGA